MKKYFLRTAFAIVAITLFYISCAPRTSDDSSPLVGKSAPDFSLQSIDNQPVKLSNLKGSVVVMDFWATWCPPCRESLPNLNRLSNDASLAKRGLKVLAVNSQEPAETVKAFVQQNHYSFAVALDADGSAERLYDVSGLPTTVVIGRDGNIRKLFVGFDPANTESELSAAINKALAE